MTSSMGDIDLDPDGWVEGEGLRETEAFMPALLFMHACIHLALHLLYSQARRRACLYLLNISAGMEEDTCPPHTHPSLPYPSFYFCTALREREVGRQAGEKNLL